MAENDYIVLSLTSLIVVGVYVWHYAALVDVVVAVFVVIVIVTVVVAAAIVFVFVDKYNQFLLIKI